MAKKRNQRSYRLTQKILDRIELGYEKHEHYDSTHEVLSYWDVRGLYVDGERVQSGIPSWCNEKEAVKLLREQGFDVVKYIREKDKKQRKGKK